ncbi:MAG: glutathione S-transferase family protein [Pseudomonadota bacterium]
MVRVYGDGLSGNCYKVKLLMALLDIEHQWTHVDILSGETKSDDFARLNANRKIPVLQLDSGEILTESNAILNYLAEGTSFSPDSSLARARVLEWQFFEQYSHEPFIAVARYIKRYLGLPEERRADYEAKQVGGHKALAVMEQKLADAEYLVGEAPTIADISLYAYTHVAHEGGFDLAPYASIRAWIARIEALPGYVAMASSGS